MAVERMKMELGGKVYGLRLRKECEVGTHCKDLCPLSERCRGDSRADMALCGLMKVLSDIPIGDFGKYIICEISENQ